MIGQTISHYTILEKLGEGGMGVVYKATDTTLHRTVALKFLPAHASGSDQDKSRFLQEARAAANLNHPNICTIHAVEEHDSPGGSKQSFIVMELVDGVTLREKLPFKTAGAAYDAAIQIGDALSEAHAKGIVHRDVKSENIMITPKGQIKVMDFGLAKLKGSLKLTRTSSTVGTLGYMSPEQIQGGEVDHRSDIFSLGVVLFEMLTGHLPFRGEHEAAILYSIVNEQPRPVTDYLKDAPAGLADILAKVLEKDPNERYQSAADLAVDLKRLKRQSAAHSRSSAGIAVPAAGPAAERADTGVMRKESALYSNANRLLGGVSLLLLGALGYLAYTKLAAPPETAAPAMTYSRLTELAGEETFPDISPDGNYIVYVRPSGATSDIFLQRIGGGNPINLTEGSATLNTHPAFSPTGDLIAFHSGRDGGGIFVMGSTGESVRRITDFGYSPSWSPDGASLVFSTEYIEHPFSRQSESKLWTVEIKGGKPAMLYAGDAVQPQWSPDGNRILFWGLPRGTGKRELWTISATGGTAERLTDDDAIDWSPVWSPDGGGVYYLSNGGGTMNLRRLPVDPATGKAAGPMQATVLPTQNCTGIRISRDGKRFIYLSTARRSNIHTMPLDPRTHRPAGPAVPVTEGSREMEYLSVSPDGGMLAFSVVGVQEDLAVMGVDGKGFRKLTNDAYKDRGPAWSHDGKRLAFYSERSGKYQVWVINVDGSGLTQLSDEQGENILAWPRWFPGDRWIHFQTDSGGSILDVSKPMDRTAVRRLKPYPGKFVFGGVCVNRDGSKVYGNLIAADGSERGIAVYSLADSTHRIIRSEGIGAYLLADERTLLFHERGTLGLLDIGTGSVSSLVGFSRFTDFSQYAPSPDDRSIYFVRIEKETDIWEARVP